ncbi:PERICYCLE FACTOR TYPE-A 6 [Hibiscus trionum]|uniref:PERICYCLE FACTOR TYPE-A 6 n=1 Tax=Hibiscus trionum TaxID=183268 RepID=A0A9W7MPT3_HIBTR|nr:PERICYCLE FACTOR TYPE-A 6 [Hibiscus trionum]
MADEFNTATNWWDSSRTAGSSSGFSFGWATEMADVKTARSPMDSVSGSSVVFQENPKLHQAMDLQMMGLGLSSQALLREPEFKQVNRGFSLDQSQFSPRGSSGDSTGTYQGLSSSFQMENSTAFYGNPSTILQVQQQSSYENRSSSINYQYGTTKQEHQQQQHQLHGQLHFSNNAPFWNPSAASMADHARPGFSPSLQPQFPAGNFDEKTKNISEVGDSSTVVKKSGNESKRPRNETPATMPAFKVRKEKMGDRITALQQLVSPFGKTDTASVLSEAIEYIKFLHEQVSVLSTPYMKNNEAAAIQHQQNPEKSKDPEGLKQDLRSRGLCLVPVSSTFPLTHDSPVDFWTPTFGGTFR